MSSIDESRPQKVGQRSGKGDRTSNPQKLVTQHSPGWKPPDTQYETKQDTSHAEHLTG